MKETTNPIASSAQPCAPPGAAPMASPVAPWRRDLSRSYPVAATIVGIDRKKENSSAAERDIPPSCPAAMVDIEREVPGKTAERIWQAPIQMAWPPWMRSEEHTSELQSRRDLVCR